MENKSIDTSITESKTVIEMITVANEFCLFTEEHEKYEMDFILSYLQRVLPLLYIKGSLLPDTESESGNDDERYVIEETWEYLFNSFVKVFGKNNTYYFWDAGLKEPVETTVAENLADMYQDLRDFVFLYSKPTYYAKLNAVNMCKELFLSHWGKLIPPLLSHIHGIIMDKKPSFDEYDV